MDDADLETHINGFLTALGERPDELIPKRLASIEQPNPQDAEDFRRYLNDLKREYGQGLLSMYTRIESHGRAICRLTEEIEITDPVRQITKLVALDGEDVPRSACRRPTDPDTVASFRSLALAFPLVAPSTETPGRTTYSSGALSMPNASAAHGPSRPAG